MDNVALFSDGSPRISVLCTIKTYSTYHSHNSHHAKYTDHSDGARYTIHTGR